MKKFFDLQSAEDEEDLSAFWLITYSDMTTLLLAFFLLIYSFTVMGEENKHTLLDALNVATSGGEMKELEKPLEEIEKTANQIAALMGQGQDESPWVDATETEVTLGLPASITFASGQAELTPRAEKFLRQAATMLDELNTPIRVAGHTDNVPIQTYQFPSNWHLSVARAQRVVQLFLQEGISPRYLQVVGYSDTQPRQPNDSIEGRRANRRIEIKIIRTDVAREEPASESAQPTP